MSFGRWQGQHITDKLIERTAQRYGRAIGIEHLSPHNLRALFITLAIEVGASLLQMQDATGHSELRTTERS